MDLPDPEASETQSAGGKLNLVDSEAFWKMWRDKVVDASRLFFDVMPGMANRPLADRNELSMVIDVFPIRVCVVGFLLRQKWDDPGRVAPVGLEDIGFYFTIGSGIPFSL